LIHSVILLFFFFLFVLIAQPFNCFEGGLQALFRITLVDFEVFFFFSEVGHVHAVLSDGEKLSLITTRTILERIFIELFKPRLELLSFLSLCHISVYE
jgi:hypothetical protein